jgi:RNA polymerase sigma-70 factor, ECF subfamily
MPQNVVETEAALASGAPGTQTNRAMREAHARGESAWPSLGVTYEQFQERAMLANGGRAMVPSHAEDFYLSAACMNAHALAHEALEAHYFPMLRHVVRATVMDAAAVDDILQNVRVRLLAGAAPKIGTYRGNGPLSGWLRRVTTHAASDHCRAKKSERRRQRLLFLAQPSHAGDDAESAARRIAVDEHERECEQAWSKAMRCVDSADLVLLHDRFARGMSIDALSPIYCVHRATIARRVHRAVQRVRRIVRNSLATQHRGLGPHELDAMMCEWSRSTSELPMQEP